MAVTRIIPIRGSKGQSVIRSLTERTDYVKAPEKTENGSLVYIESLTPSWTLRAKRRLSLSARKKKISDRHYLQNSKNQYRFTTRNCITKLSPMVLSQESNTRAFRQKQGKSPM